MNPAPVSGLNRPIRLCGTLMTMAAYSRTQAQMREQCCSFADGFYFHLQRNGDGQGEKAPKPKPPDTGPGTTKLVMQLCHLGHYMDS